MKNYLCRLLLIFAFALISVSNSFAKMRHFSYLDINNGLAHTDVTCVTQDQSGLIWLGTFSGLQSFDGYQTKKYDFYKPNMRIRGLSNRVKTIAECGDLIWVGSDGGLNCFSLAMERYVDFKVGGDFLNPSDPVVKLSTIDSSRGVLWIKTKKECYFAHFNAESSTLERLEWAERSEQRLSTGLISVVGRDREHGKIWVANLQNLYELTFEHGTVCLSVIPEVRHRIVGMGNIINLSSNGYDLYLRTQLGCAKIPILGNGLLGVDHLQKMIYAEIDPSFAKNSGQAVADSNGTIWSTLPVGLLEITDPFGTPISTIHKSEPSGNSLSSNFISSLYIDTYDNLWVGTWGGGVNIISTREPMFKSVTSYNAFSGTKIDNSHVKDVEEASEGRIWILTQFGGLHLYDKEDGVIESTTFPSIDMPIKQFKSVVKSPDGKRLYIGMLNGLLRYDLATRRATQLMGAKGDDENSNSFNTNINSMTFDCRGRLWVGTWSDGIYVVDDSKSECELVYHIESSDNTHISLCSNIVSYLYYDAEEDEVFACTSEGLSRFGFDSHGNINRCGHYCVNNTNSESLTNSFISAIDKQKSGVYWIGTLGGGVNRVEINSFEDNDYSASSYTMADGLQTNDAEIVFVDEYGIVWVGGYGISRIDPMTRQILTFDNIDGLQSNSFKIGSSCKGRDGVIYMGGIDGLNYFDPAVIKKPWSAYEMVLTDLHVHNHLQRPMASYNGKIALTSALNSANSIELQYDQNDFAISFAALGYRLSNRVVYRFRLKGYEREWIETSVNLNKAYYSNLDYGIYIFELQISSDSGLSWSQQTKRLKISVIPPWWLNPIAIILYVIIALTLLWFFLSMYIAEKRMKRKIMIDRIESEKAEENHQLKLQFFMNISHELKTPLTIIISAIERVDMEMIPQLRDSVYFSSISRNAHKLLGLITELVDFRKSDLGVSESIYSYSDLTEHIITLSTEFTPWAMKKGLELRRGELERIETSFDEEKVTKVFCNLLSNAIKYSDKSGGEIEFSLSRGSSTDFTPTYRNLFVVNSHDEPFDAVLLRVRDCGVGISATSITKIYDRFFQVVSCNSSHIGSGIGLAVAKGLVLSMNGNITVSSERGRGTEFIVALPVVSQGVSLGGSVSGFDVSQYIEDQHLEFNYEEPLAVASVAESSADEPQSQSQTERATILLVEDNVELLANLKDYFSRQYNVLTAEDGAVGLELCREHNPDLIVTDVMMPVMNGVEMCRSIRENLSLAYMPIIMLTAKSDVEHQIEGYESGADLYIPKPFSLKVLELNVSRLIEQKRRMLSVDYKCDTPELEEVKEPEEQDVQPQQEGHSTDKVDLDVSVREKLQQERDAQFIDKMNQYLRDNLSNPDMSVTQLCTELCVGRTKLYCQVKELCGKSLGDYIRDMRLERSAELLRTTDMNIIEVIYETGFGSNSYFSKVFKSRFGITPSDYAKGKQ